MQDSKLIEVLQSLSQKECTSFSLFVQSPYYNKNIAIQKLCNYLLKFAPDFQDAEALKKEVIYAHVYSTSVFHDADFHSLFSKLLKLLYQFLSLQIWEEEENLQNIYLIEQIRRKSLSEKHISLIKKQKEQKNIYPLDSKDYYEHYLYYFTLDSYELNFGIKNSHKNYVNLKNQAFDEYYILEKLRIYCDMYNRLILSSEVYIISFFEEIENYLKQNSLLQKNAIIYVYWHVLQFLKNNSLKDYNLVYAYMLDNRHKFSENERRIIYGFIINFCILQINSGKVNYYADLQQHYEYLITTSILYKDNYLSAVEYKQIITIYIRLEKYEESKQFALMYKDKLIPSQKENIYNFNLANILCEEGSFAAALSLLINIELWDYGYQIGYRLIQVKCYFSLQESQAFYALIDSFVIYLKRNNIISEHIRSININFLRLCKKLYLLREQEKLKLISSDKILAKIQEMELILRDESLQIANKLWLLKQFQKFKSCI